MPAFSLDTLHTWFTPLLHGSTTLPYQPPCTRRQFGIRSFGGVLEPRYIVGAGSLDQ